MHDLCIKRTFYLSEMSVVTLDLAVNGSKVYEDVQFWTLLS